MSQSPELTHLLSPAQLGGLTLKNRVIKTATFEGMTPRGVPTPELIEFHCRVAAGGTALTTVGQCNVSPDARNLETQMHFRRELIPDLRRLTDAVHNNGGHIAAQLTHCGYFKMNAPVEYRRPLAPSFRFNKLGAPYGRPFADAMTKAQVHELIDHYVRAAVIAREAGFDVLEIMMAHGYLLSQFISPNINRRRDEFGGSLENRMRVPVAIVERLREEMGPELPLIAKINLDDACRGGIHIDDAVQVAQILEQSGIDAILTSAGRSPGDTSFLFRGDSPMPTMIRLQTNPLMKLALKCFGHLQYRPMPYRELYLLEMARKIRTAVRCNVIYLGGVSTAESMQTVMREGFDFVALGRALIKDPQMVNQLAREPGYVNGCTHCNQCVALIYHPRGVHCALNP